MSDLYGVLGVFDTPEAVTQAASRLSQSGFRDFEAYTPYPIEELNTIIHPGPNRFLPLLMFVAAILGAAWGYWIQVWDEVIDYPINVGGRPHNSWPAFVVGAFEFMLLVTVSAGFVGMLAASRLPRLYHPIFESKSFVRATRNRFIICIRATDPNFDLTSVHDAFVGLGAEGIEEVHA